MTTNPNEPKRQPKTIKFNGRTYKLKTPFRWIDEKVGINEGPHYTCKEVPGVVFMPDAGYLYAGQKLGFMHMIVQFVY
jgi:hypothetical protein